MTGDRSATGAPVVRRVTGAGLLAHAEGVRTVYAEAFALPPWREDPAAADGYLTRLADDAARPGFTGAVALGAPADGAPSVLGFAAAWPAPTPLPDVRSYPALTEALGARRAEAWLCGARQVDELAVRPAAHGLGLGRALLAAAIRDAPDGRCWLLTSPRATDAVRLYRRAGWQQVVTPALESRDLTLFLAPGHPAVPEAAAHSHRALS
ncbi:GNAT family N-acetyltransferase [Streptomyces silaceus]|uniref:GNAT family N-acetyltransferase n=1 Tax=Streptomyces silaceus TaxID=545123 RepID=UPI000AB1B53B|nr:GNAT family N-acetyltransferase [Streptomyces silaceus]